MYEEMTAASTSYVDMTWQVAALYWGNSQRLAKLQTEAGVRLFTESADRLKDTFEQAQRRSIDSGMELALSEQCDQGTRYGAPVVR